MVNNIFRPNFRLASYLLLIGGCWALPGSRTIAQSNIVPDQSLGTEGSQVVPNMDGSTNEVIQGGAKRGANLFHSFQEFNINAGRGAYFANPAGVNNILTRVTGNNLSDINGTLGVLGNANLYLINPNGILFGPNASLDLSGSFLASTAGKITFPDGRDFDAQVGQESAFLSINVPEGLQWGNRSAPVVVQGASLSVDKGQSLALAGGDVQIEDGQLEASGGRVDLSGVAADGGIEFGSDGGLIVSEDVARANVLLTNSSVDVASSIGGDISITAQNVDILESSSLFAGSNGSVEAQSGDISINATNKISISQASKITNNSFGKGSAGSIEIDTRSLILKDGVLLSASTSGKGDAGIVKISASDSVLLQGESTRKERNSITSQVTPGAKGNAGGVEIDTRSLILKDGALLSANTFGEGDAGTVRVRASDSILLQGENTKGLRTNVSSRVRSSAKGNAGDVEIDTRSLILKDGTFISANTSGKGDAGTVKISASDSVLLQEESMKRERSNIASQVTSGAKGNAGGVEINTRSLILKDGAFLSASTFGEGDAGTVKIKASDSVLLQGESTKELTTKISSRVRSSAKGNAGDVEIDTRSLILKDGAFLSTSTFGEGDAGTVKIKASDSVLLQGEDSQGDRGFITSDVNSGAKGNAGGIEIDTRSLILKDGALLSANTFDKGDAGTVKISASDSVLLQGESRQGKRNNISSQVFSKAKGNAGGIEIDTRSLILKDGAFFAASTLGEGDAGNIVVKANTLSLTDGSQIESNTEKAGAAGSIIVQVRENITLSGEDTGILAKTTISSTGNGGSIFIDPVSVTINDGAQIAVNSEGTGQGGDIKLISGSLTLDQGTISAETASNLGGNIDLSIGNQLLLRNNSLISATAGTSQAGGDGGNIDIDTALLVAFPQENSDIIANAFEGAGGNIQISTQGIFGTAFRDQLTLASDITASSNFGTDGTVQLDTSLDPTSGLVDLPVQPPQPQQVAQTCTPSGSSAQSEFVYTGRGGLPPASQQVLNQRNIDVDWVGLDSKNDNERQQHPSISHSQSAPPVESERPQTPQLVEAQGWTTTQDGKVRLTASTTTAPHHLAQRVCPGA